MTKASTYGLYRWSCGNCGGETDDLRLSRGFPCRSCIPDDEVEKLGPAIDMAMVYGYLKDSGRLKGYKRIYSLRSKLESLEIMFNRATGSCLWSAQRAWSVRVFKGGSFSIASPTGTGKTLFGIIISIYLTGRPRMHA